MYTIVNHNALGSFSITGGIFSGYRRIDNIGMLREESSGLGSESSRGGQGIRHQNYDSWWEYYLWPKTENPPYSHREPPSDPPTYHDWNYFIPHSGALIPEAVEFNSRFLHPYGP